MKIQTDRIDEGDTRERIHVTAELAVPDADLHPGNVESLFGYLRDALREWTLEAGAVYLSVQTHGQGDTDG